MNKVNVFSLKRCFKASAVAVPIVLLSCTAVTFEPGAGTETVMVETIRHPNDIEIEYLRSPADPLKWKGQAWTLLWLIPVNRPDLGLWLKESLPPGADAANVRATVSTPFHGHLLYFCTIGLVRFQNIEFQADPVHLIPAPYPLYPDGPALPKLGSIHDADTTPTLAPKKSL